eukprot:TRINITY_DN4271_c1_g2_i9.p1 TRINITY_DN4271_c1_g2~~TRINITY_DN4271_c1_g2_i9.p1  ORF type:complete len:283 (-),score=51.59 TRINITY_DN4271_c1_g2_i9:68-916(-)
MPPNPNNSLRVVTEAEASSFPIFASAYGVVGILVSYFIALSLGHVGFWPPPYISDCGTHPPESYIFRFCLVSMGLLVSRMSYLTIDYIRAHGTPDAADMTNWKMAFVSGLCLSGVGCVQANEFKLLHTSFAVVFFVLSVFYMRRITPRLHSITQNVTDEVRVAQTRREKWTRVASVLALIVVAHRTIEAVTGFGDPWGSSHHHHHRHHTRHHSAHDASSRHHHDHHHSFGMGGPLRTGLVIVEWSLTLLIIIFYSTMAPDFKSDNFSDGTLVPPQNYREHSE